MYGSANDLSYGYLGVVKFHKLHFEELAQMEILIFSVTLLIQTLVILF
jgi:hypothetical protein